MMMRYAKPFKLFFGSLFASFLYVGGLVGADLFWESDDASIPQTCEECCESDCAPNPDANLDCLWYGTECDSDRQYARSHHLWGIFMPEDPPLFRPLIADPRQLTYSAGWRFNDKALVRNVVPVSFYDRLPVFCWVDVWKWRGDLQLELEGGVWAVFDPLHDSSPLMDADYYVGFPLTYAFDTWAIRLRGYHISTHIGDEFLLDHKHFKRRNPSIEAFDLFVSDQYTRDIRLYGGIGFVACQDDSFRLGRLYLQAGLELRLFEIGYYDYCNRLYGVPIFGMNFYYQSHFKNHINQTYVLGYEWGKTSGLQHRLRLFLEYHDGYSVDGQFSIFPTHYFSIRASYGY